MSDYTIRFYISNDDLLLVDALCLKHKALLVVGGPPLDVQTSKELLRHDNNLWMIIYITGGQDQFFNIVNEFRASLSEESAQLNGGETP